MRAYIKNLVLLRKSLLEAHIGSLQDAYGEKIPKHVQKSVQRSKDELKVIKGIKRNFHKIPA